MLLLSSVFAAKMRIPLGDHMGGMCLTEVHNSKVVAHAGSGLTDLQLWGKPVPRPRTLLHKLLKMLRLLTGSYGCEKRDKMGLMTL